MHITIVGKYPPLEGGTAGQTLWLAHRLAENGIDVSVVTSGDFGGGEVCASISDADWIELQSRYRSFSRVEVLPIEVEGKSAYSIPRGDHLVSRLASKAIEVSKRRSSAALVGIYFEPYCIAAFAAASALEIPFGIIHAGSDLDRLARLSTRRALYGEVLSHATVVVSTVASGRRALALGAGFERLIVDRPALEPESLYSSAGSVLNLRTLQNANRHVTDDVISQIEAGVPVLCMYGKPGPKKGFTELVRAASIMAASKVDFVLILVVGIGASSDQLRRDVVQLGIADQTIILPFLPPWRIPELVRLASICCFFEHDFLVDTHRPQVPREIVSGGTCIAISREAAEKQRVDRPFIDNLNSIIIDDVSDVSSVARRLAEVLSKPDRLSEIIYRSADMFPKPSDVRSRQWTAELVESLAIDPGGHRMTLQDFQNALMAIYTNAEARLDFSSGSDHAGVDLELSRRERQVINTLASSPEIEVFAQDLLRKKWGFMSRRFPGVLTVYPKVNSEVRDVFFVEWTFEAQSLCSQVSRFAGMVRSVGEAAFAADSKARNALEFTSRVLLAEWTARVLLGNDSDGKDELSPQVNEGLTEQSRVFVPASVALVTLPVDVLSKQVTSDSPLCLAIAPDLLSLEARYLVIPARLFSELSLVRHPRSVTSIVNSVLVGMSVTQVGKGDVRRRIFDSMLKMRQLGILHVA